MTIFDGDSSYVFVRLCIGGREARAAIHKEFDDLFEKTCI